MYTNNLSKVLQKIEIDLYEAFDEIQSTIEILADKLADIDVYIKKIIQISGDCATILDIEPTLCSRRGRKKRDENEAVESMDAILKRTMVKPFLEHMIDELKRRFSEKHAQLYLPSRLICSKIISLEADKIEEISAALYETYSDDLSADLSELISEILRWQKKWQDKEEQLRPKTILDSLKECNLDYYPNLFILLKIFSILPVSSAQCERAFSTLKRLKTYLRSTMVQSRLTNLALINIHFNLNIDPEEIVKIFMNQPNHRFW